MHVCPTFKLQRTELMGDTRVYCGLSSIFTFAEHSSTPKMRQIDMHLTLDSRLYFREFTVKGSMQNVLLRTKIKFGHYFNICDVEMFGFS